MVISIRFIINKVDKSIKFKSYKKLFNIFLFILLASSLVVYSKSVWSGDFDLSEVRKNYYTPSYYYEISEWLNEERSSEFFRTLWVPYTIVTEANLKWLDPHHLGLPTGSLDILTIPDYIRW